MLEVLVGLVYLNNETGRRVQTLMIAESSDKELFVVYDYIYRNEDDGDFEQVRGYQEFLDTHTKSK